MFQMPEITSAYIPLWKGNSKGYESLDTAKSHFHQENHILIDVQLYAENYIFYVRNHTHPPIFRVLVSDLDL
jgi:hypothetical protein